MRQLGSRVLAVAGAQCCLCLSLLGLYISVNRNFGPVSSVLSPPGRRVPDGLNLGGRFGAYSGWRIWARGLLLSHPGRRQELDDAVKGQVLGISAIKTLHPRGHVPPPTPSNIQPQLFLCVPRPLPEGDRLFSKVWVFLSFFAKTQNETFH